MQVDISISPSSFFFRAWLERVRECLPRKRPAERSFTARTLRVRPGRSPPCVNQALYMAHAMCRQVADFRKSLETLSRAARRSAKPAPPGYLNGPRRFHESERKDAFPQRARDLDARLRSRRVPYILIRACVGLGARSTARSLDERTGVRCAVRKWRN